MIYRAIKHYADLKGLIYTSYGFPEITSYGFPEIVPLKHYTGLKGLIMHLKC